MKARLNRPNSENNVKSHKSTAYLYEIGKEEFIIQAQKGLSLSDVKSSDLGIKLTEKIFWFIVSVFNIVFKDNSLPEEILKDIKKVKRITVKEEDGTISDLLLNGPLCCYSFKENASLDLKIKTNENSQTEVFKNKLKNGYEAINSDYYQINWFSRKERKRTTIRIKGNGRREFVEEEFYTPEEELLVGALKLETISLIAKSLLIGKCPKKWLDEFQGLDEKKQIEKLDQNTLLLRNSLIYLSAFIHYFSKDLENLKFSNNIWDLDSFFEKIVLIPEENGKIYKCLKNPVDFQENQYYLKTSTKKMKKVIELISNSQSSLEYNCSEWCEKIKLLEVGLNIFIIDSNVDVIDCIADKKVESKKYVKIDCFLKDANLEEPPTFERSFLLDIESKKYIKCIENCESLSKMSIEQVIETVYSTMVYMKNFSSFIGGPWKFPYSVEQNCK